MPPSGWTLVPNSDWTDGNNVRIRLVQGGRVARASLVHLPVHGRRGQDMSGGILAVSAPTGRADQRLERSEQRPGRLENGDGAVDHDDDCEHLAGLRRSVRNDRTFTPPAGMTEQWDMATSGANYKVSTETATQPIASAGATGTRIATLSSSCRNVAINLAVAPAPG